MKDCVDAMPKIAYQALMHMSKVREPEDEAVLNNLSHSPSTQTRLLLDQNTAMAKGVRHLHGHAHVGLATYFHIPNHPRAKINTRVPLIKLAKHMLHTKVFYF